MKTRVSTTIEASLYEEIKSSGWKFNELIIIGAQAKKGMPKILDRIKELEEGNMRLNHKISELFQSNVELETKLQMHKAENGA